MKTKKTPIAVLSYPHLFKPHAVSVGDPEKFSCTLIFTPEAQSTPEFKALKQVALETAQERWPDAADQFKANRLRWPFRSDWKAKGYPEGSVFLNVRSDYAPRVVDHNVRPIPEARSSEVYAGALVYAAITPYCYDRSGNKGVTFGLDHVQKVGNGPRLDGRPDPSNVFDVVEGESIAAPDFETSDEESIPDGPSGIDELFGDDGAF